MKKLENEIPRIYLESAVEKFLSNKTLTENSIYTLEEMCRQLGHASKNGRAKRM